MTQQTLQISNLAHIKIILHALHYDTGPIHGILIGRYPAASQLQIEDCIPICHSAPTKPLLDIAFRLVQSHLETNAPDTKIVGWYTANERVNDMLPNPAAFKIIESIASQQQQSSSSSSSEEPVLILLNSLVISDMIEGGQNGENPLDTYGPLYPTIPDQKKQWTLPISKDAFKVSKEQLDLIQSIISKTNIPPLYDFENHLEGIGNEIKERDWLGNPAVAQTMANA